MHDDNPNDPNEELGPEDFLSSLNVENKNLLQHNKVLRETKVFVHYVGFAHDSQIGGHFLFARSLSRPSNFC